MTEEREMPAPMTSVGAEVGQSFFHSLWLSSICFIVVPSAVFHSILPFAFLPITIAAAIEGLVKIKSFVNVNSELIVPSLSILFLNRFKLSDILGVVDDAITEPFLTTNPSDTV